MPTLRVVGPVVDGADIGSLYKDIAAAAERHGWSVELPERRHELDHAPPDAFVKQIRKEIRRANAIVSVLTPGDQSVPVESAIASFSNKHQLAIADGVQHVPRMVSGLPGVRHVVDGSDRHAVTNAVDELVRHPRRRW